jgi:NAD-dependent DNA ligase
MPTNILPAWHFEPATIRQLKVLRFFGIDVSSSMTKGKASGIIGRLFSDFANEHLWKAYVYTTGDERHDSEDILPHDKAVLACTPIPDDWHRERAPALPSLMRRELEGLVGEVLKDGSPFDDPTPDVSAAGTTFCFTGRFGFGSRRDCQEAAVCRGGFFTEEVSGKTDALVVGNDASPAWANGRYGRKIETAMVLRMRSGKPLIISEAHWTRLLGASGASKDP